MRNILVLCVLLVVLVCIFIIPSIGCDLILRPAPLPAPLPSVLYGSGTSIKGTLINGTPWISYDFTKVVTMGNHSYIPFNKPGNPADMTMDILNVMDQFEKKHLEWEITGWHIEKQQGSRDESSHDGWHYVFGLWVDHKSPTSK